MIIVSCPECHQQYRVNTDKIKNQNPKFRCLICQTRFSFSIGNNYTTEQKFVGERVLDHSPESLRPSTNHLVAENGEVAEKQKVLSYMQKAGYSVLVFGALLILLGLLSREWRNMVGAGVSTSLIAVGIISWSKQRLA